MDTIRKRRKNDIMLLAGLLLLGALLLLTVGAVKNDGGRIEVQVDGKTEATYPLDTDTEVDLDYNGYNKLVILNGEAEITEADCPDKLCTEQRKISKTGETITCLPHRTVVIVRDGEQPEYDGVVE